MNSVLSFTLSRHFKLFTIVYLYLDQLLTTRVILVQNGKEAIRILTNINILTVKKARQYYHVCGKFKLVGYTKSENWGFPFS